MPQSRDRLQAVYARTHLRGNGVNRLETASGVEKLIEMRPIVSRKTARSKVASDQTETYKWNFERVQENPETSFKFS